MSPHRVQAVLETPLNLAFQNVVHGPGAAGSLGQRLANAESGPHPRTTDL